MSCVNLPLIVAKGEFLSQATDIATTTLYHVINPGFYRVTLYTIQLGSNSQINDIISWTNEDGAATFNFPSSGGSAAASFGQIYNLYCTASSSIQFSTVVTFGPAIYNSRYLIEAL